MAEFYTVFQCYKDAPFTGQKAGCIRLLAVAPQKNALGYASEWTRDLPSESTMLIV